MGKSVLVFLSGFLAAIVVLTVLFWLGRTHIMSWMSIGYQYVDRPVLLLKDFRIYQNGVEVGVLKSGTQINFIGYDKTSPIENYSIMLGWENRGTEREKLVKEIPRDKRVFMELKEQ